MNQKKTRHPNQTRMAQVGKTAAFRGSARAPNDAPMPVPGLGIDASKRDRDVAELHKMQAARPTKPPAPIHSGALKAGWR